MAQKGLWWCVWLWLVFMSVVQVYVGVASWLGSFVPSSPLLALSGLYWLVVGLGCGALPALAAVLVWRVVLFPPKVGS